MRVLHVITGLHAGGAEQFLHSLLQHVEHDHEVVALSNAGVVAERLRASGVRVTDLGMRGNRDLRALPTLYRLIRRSRFDVVHTHLVRAQLFGGLAARLARVPVVVTTEHSLKATDLEGRSANGPGIMAIYRAVGALHHGVTAVTAETAARLRPRLGPRGTVEVVPLGIDADRFAFDPELRARTRAELGIPADRPVVGAVGRLVPLKRFDLLVRSLAGLDADLIVVGEGPCRSDLESLAREQGVADRVHLVGEVGDVRALLSAVDVVASPCPEETFGIAIIEALAAGVPVLYASCPALDGLDAAPGRAVPSTVEDFRRELATALGTASADRPAAPVVAHFSIRRSARAFESFYRTHSTGGSDMQVLETLGDREVRLWGRSTVRLPHRLAQDELFTDESLAKLIDTLSPARVSFRTMVNEPGEPAEWRHCDRGGLTGEQIVALVRTGRLWINMVGLQEEDPRFAELLDGMYADLEGGLPGFRTVKHKIGLLLSSPGAEVPYHVDVPGQGIWQIRGRKRVWIYPPHEPFLQQHQFEAVAREVKEEELAYEPWFDDHAEVYDAEAGDMLHWRLNSPHRVTNHDSVNVSLTTEHTTAEIRRSFVVNFANGILRSAGWRPRSTALTGPAYWAKLGLAAAAKLSGAQARQRHRKVFDYVLDPAAPGGARKTVPADSTIGSGI